MRISKENYYLNIAQQCSQRGTCLRRNYGAIIVKNDEIISTGYTGSPRGRINCIDRGTCLREDLKVPSGERYEICRSVHAEMNACIHASRCDMIGATMYLCGLLANGEIFKETVPCMLCKRVIINSGIQQVIVRRDENSFESFNPSEWEEE